MGEDLPCARFFTSVVSTCQQLRDRPSHRPREEAEAAGPENLPQLHRGEPQDVGWTLGPHTSMSRCLAAAVPPFTSVSLSREEQRLPWETRTTSFLLSLLPPFTPLEGFNVARGG